MDEAGRCRVERLRRLEWDQGSLLFLNAEHVILQTLRFQRLQGVRPTDPTEEGKLYLDGRCA
jgi:hypothetical protein